ncbi:MAG: 16S rRNA (adenine(1518)-N(6)/adenine(1519)-N(6))-dimethyltransferase RsmA [Pseudomonadota bacterium]
MTGQQIADLPPLREVIATHGLAARKALGQNFLLDLNLTTRIARAAGDLSGCNIVEIGPGPGGLTRAILMEGAQRLVAVERDRRCLEALEPLVECANGRLALVDADALKVDPVALIEAPRAIIANLPYNIATPLLLRWLKSIDAFQVLVLMFQKEVGDRLLASPGSKTYGRLSVITQWRAEVQGVMTLPARAFTPAPKVESTVVRLTPRQNPEPAAFEAMETVTAAAFGQRRKMLRSSLRTLCRADQLLAETGLDPTARAETIDVAGFAALARAYQASRSD